MSAHASAVEVTEEQPSKIAMMEGHYEEGTLPLYLIGYVDKDTQEVVAPLKLEGFTSFLASNSFDTEYPGLNDLAKENADLDVDNLPIGVTFVSYHLMVLMFGAIVIVLALALIASYKKGSKLKDKKWWQWILVLSPIFPFLAIESGWTAAEVGRQPYVVYPATSSPDGLGLLTNDAISSSLSSVELLVTILLFIIVYTFIFIAWARLITGFIGKGPVDDLEGNPVSDEIEEAK